ncbi:MAG: hypothetical protein ACLFP4_14775 [Spirochaetales bacterium]
MSSVSLLPPSIDNNYRGPRIAVIVFWLLAAVTLVRSVIHIVAPDGGAASIATIPLASFSPAAADAVIHIFALWGLSQLIIGVFYVVALLRYRTLIPMLYLFALFEYVVRLTLTWIKPMETESTAPGAIGNYVLIPILLVMFLVSLASRPRKAKDFNRSGS